MSDVEFEALVEPFCDNYCRYPRICRDQDKLEEKCEECPICKIVEKLEQVEMSEEPSEPSCREQIMRTFLGGR